MTPKPAGFRQSEKLTEQEAEQLTTEIVEKLSAAYRDVVPLIVRAFRGRAWVAVGYNSWDDYCRANFHGPRMLRFSDEQLTELCIELAGEGFSVRAIGSATGVGHATAARKIRSAKDQPTADVIRLSDGARIRRQEKERTEAVYRAMDAHPSGKGLSATTPVKGPAETILMHISLTAGEGLTCLELVEITGWRESVVTGALSTLVRSRAVAGQGRRAGAIVWVAQ